MFRYTKRRIDGDSAIDICVVSRHTKGSKVRTMGKGEITYNQQIAFCGKSRCRKCREGIGHGPYWYAYKTVNGRTTRTYIGKTLPPHIQPRANKAEDQTLLRVQLLGPFRMQRRTAPIIHGKPFLMRYGPPIHLPATCLPTLSAVPPVRLRANLSSTRSGHIFQRKTLVHYSNKPQPPSIRRLNLPAQKSKACCAANQHSLP